MEEELLPLVLLLPAVIAKNKNEKDVIEEKDYWYQQRNSNNSNCSNSSSRS